MSEKSQEQIKAETEEWMQKHRPASTVVNVSKEQAEKIREILGKKGENENMEKGEFEKQSEFEDRMRKFVKEMRAEQAEEKLIEASQKEADIQFKEGGKGNVGLRAEDLAHERGSSEQKEFSTHEEMIKYCKEFDKESYAKLWEKTVQDMKKAPNIMLNSETIFPNALEDVKQAQNEKWKKENSPKKVTEN